MGMSCYLKAEDKSMAVDVDESDRKGTEDIHRLPFILFTKGFLKQPCTSAELKQMKSKITYDVK